MRILHVDTEKGWRGGEQQLFYLVKGLKERGVEVAVACRVGDELERRCREEGITVYPLKGNQTGDILRVGALGKNYDIIHAHAAKAHTIAAFSKKFHKKPVIYTRRVDYPPKKNPLTELKYKLTDKVVAITEFVADVLKKELNLKGIEVIYSAVDENLPEKIETNKVKTFREKFKGKKIIGSVAALTEQKNIPNLIEAARILLKERNDLAFVVFGEGKLKSYLQSLIKEKGLEGSFLLAGFKEDVYNYVKGFDVFVLPSDYEGLGSSLLIAMLLNVPVVATKVGGVPEVIKDGETGLLVERRNPVKLADAILRLLDGSKLRKRITTKAYSVVVDNFSVGRMVDAYLRLYGEVVGV
ncbi:glycosyltransferase family 4 protein [Phorcysia thermohydrogeniphila]|uniref:Glycosyltransferase involved in cell wall biosynthesis n=1 Tax=Phorcysia thermohydrogeniphila TaxID=936138 RepID=A0A4R1G8C5_9BACT|nr:glycosyltransferase family 4 protein [Phorcysia thermohydrogeniphila]TCK02911.1 glycosyltransferase involved in cell wall biosynthesis [Phorcysia thermohydrogeniphila]